MGCLQLPLFVVKFEQNFITKKRSLIFALNLEGRAPNELPNFNFGGRAPMSCLTLTLEGRALNELPNFNFGRAPMSYLILTLEGRAPNELPNFNFEG